MFYLVMSLHIFLCLALIVLVLLQQGKGASAGAVLGGSSNTLFGATGANTLITKVTTGFAIAFMFTSVVLIRLYSSHVSSRTGELNTLQGSVMNERIAAGQMAGAPAETVAESTNSNMDAVKAETTDDKSAEGQSAKLAAPPVGEPAKAAVGPEGVGKKTPEKTGGKK